MIMPLAPVKSLDPHGCMRKCKEAVPAGLFNRGTLVKVTQNHVFVWLFTFIIYYSKNYRGRELRVQSCDKYSSGLSEYDQAQS